MTIEAADALFTGLADAEVSSASLRTLKEKLQSIRPGTPDKMFSALREALTSDEQLTTPAASLLTVLPALLRHFRPGHHVAEIIASLATETDPRYADWAQRTHKTLLSRTPLMMCVTRELLLRGRRMDLADCLRLEYDVGQHSFREGDFDEGVRAVLVDKDHAPKWQQQRVEEVADERVLAFFVPHPSSATFPLRTL